MFLGKTLSIQTDLPHVMNGILNWYFLRQINQGNIEIEVEECVSFLRGIFVVSVLGIWFYKILFVFCKTKYWIILLYFAWYLRFKWKNTLKEVFEWDLCGNKASSELQLIKIQKFPSSFYKINNFSRIKSLLEISKHFKHTKSMEILKIFFPSRNS